MTNLERLKLELSNKSYYTDEEYNVFLNENNLVPTDTYDKVNNEIDLLKTVVNILETLSNDVDLMRKIDSKDITSIDLLVTCKEEIYQDISLTPAGNCRWQSNPKLVEKVVEFWSGHMEDIVKPIAREVDEDTLLAQAGLDIGTNASDVDFSEFI